METAVMEPPTVSKSTAVANILERSVCIVLRCGFLGNHRRVALDAVDIEKSGEKLTRTNKDEMGATKRLFATADLAQCHAAVAAVKNQLRALSVSGGQRLFGDGAYLIPRLAIEQAEQILIDGAAAVRIQAAVLAGRLEALKADRKTKLGPLYVESDYPSQDDVEAAYRIDWNYVRFGSPEQLEDVDVAIAARAREKWQANLSSAYDEIVVGLRATAAQVARELVERLTPTAEGRPKVLKATALRDLTDLFDKLPLLNSIGDDDALTTVVAKLSAVASGVDVEMLRKSDGLRAMLRTAAEQATAQLDGLIQSGRRAISFGPLGGTEE